MQSSRTLGIPSSVTLGGITYVQLLAQLEAAGVKINSLAQLLFADARFVTAPTAYRAEIVSLTVADLGLPNGGTYAQVLAQARIQGLYVCPLELAVHLRLQWMEQPELPAEAALEKHRAPYGAVTVAIDAPPDEPDIPWGFYLRKLDGVVWLRGNRCCSGHIWGASDHLVFMLA